MKQTISYFLVFATLTIPCKSQNSKVNVLGQHNLTEYIFHFPQEVVKKAIIKGLDNYKFQSTIGKEKLNIDEGEIIQYESLHAQSYDAKNKNMWSDAVKVLSKPEFNNDVYLYTYGYSPSQVYYAENRKDPLIFSADFHLHIDIIDNQTTKVSIKTINHRVITGKELLPTIQMCGFGRSVIVQEFAPTTVEEYELLLKVGKELNEKNMPKMIFPAKIYLTRTGKVAR